MVNHRITTAGLFNDWLFDWSKSCISVKILVFLNIFSENNNLCYFYFLFVGSNTDVEFLELKLKFEPSTLLIYSNFYNIDSMLLHVFADFTYIHLNFTTEIVQQEFDLFT